MWVLEALCCIVHFFPYSAVSVVSLTPAQSPLSHPSSSSLLICTSLSIVQSTWCLPPLRSPFPALLAPRRAAPDLPHLCVPAGVGRTGSAVPARPSRAQSMLPWHTAGGARPAQRGAALELWWRTGWSCRRFPRLPSSRTAERCGVGLGGLSDTQAPPGMGRRLGSPCCLLSVLCSGIVGEHQHHH